MQRIQGRIIHNSRGRARKTAECVVFLQQLRAGMEAGWLA
jgi:hypothetical protein